MKVEDRLGINLAEQARIATFDLASIMRRGYAVRVAADYSPTIPVTRGNANRFSLVDTDITDAHNWINKARYFSPIILRGWKLSE